MRLYSVTVLYSNFGFYVVANGEEQAINLALELLKEDDYWSNSTADNLEVYHSEEVINGTAVMMSD